MDELYSDLMEIQKLAETIIKAAFEVHEELGTGFAEKVYENALALALQDLGLASSQQCSLKVYFRERLVGDYFADIIVMDTVIVELKTVQSLLPELQAQLINYLTATRSGTGLLINFARKGLEIKRLYSKSR